MKNLSSIGRITSKTGFLAVSLLLIANMALPTASSAQTFNNLWTQTNNPSGSDDWVQAMTADASGIYVAGTDYSPGNRQWRIEKHNLTTGVLIAGFGTGGVVTSNPSLADDYIRAITVDASGIYVAGFDRSPTPNWNDAQWRIEKRDLTTGALIAAFGTGGVVTNNPSLGDDYIQAITANASGIYVAGVDWVMGNYEWRIEKRDLTTGALITGFGILGTVTNNPSTGPNFDDIAYAITADVSGIYVAGFDAIPGASRYQWRIEKRNLTTGALIAGFGTAGVVSSNPSAGNDIAYAITADASGIYVAGYDGSPLADVQWRIEKRDLTTGALIAGFGTAGVVTNDPSPNPDIAYAITADASGIYVAGMDDIPFNNQWRIEKRDLTTGALTCIVTSNPSSNSDYAQAITADASGIYVAGWDEIPGNYQWRIEKYDLCGVAPVANFSSSDSTLCTGQCIDFTDRSTNIPTSWSWSFSGGTPGTSTAQHPTTICYHNPGTYNVTLTSNNTIGPGTTTKTNFITVSPTPSPNAGSNKKICDGDSVQLLATGGTAYSWSPTTGLSNPSIANPKASPAQTTTYIVTVGNAGGCTANDTVIVLVDSAYLSTQKKSVNYGVLVCADTLRDSVITVRNTGATSITVTPSLEGNDPSQFSFTPSSATIPVGGTASFTARFQPGGNNTYSARIRFAGDPCGRSDTTHLEGTKNSDATISVTPLPKLLFDTLVCPEPAYRDSIVHIKNTGTLTVTLNPPTVSGPGFSLLSPTTQITLAPQKDTVYRIRFMPTQGAKTYNGSFSVAGSPCNVTQTISLVGVKDSVKILASVKTLTFDTLKCGDSVKILTVNVNNVGTKTLTVLTNNPGDGFTVIPSSQTIANGNSAQFTITFKPSGAGSYKGVVKFTGSLCSVVDSVQVSGVKKDNVKISSYPNELNFSQVICNEPDSTIIVNKGTDTVYLDPATISGNGFTLLSPTGSIKLAPGDSIIYKIKFLPRSGIGNYTGQLTVTGSPCGIVLRHDLSGRKDSAAIVGTPTSINFGDNIPCTGDIDKTFTIRNTGTVTDTIASAVFTSNGNAFEIISPTIPFTIASGSAQDVLIRLRSNKLTDSVLTTQLRFIGNPCDITVEVSLEGRKRSPVVALSIFSSTVTVGHHTLIPIELSQPFNGEVKSYTIECSYDSTLLLPHRCETGGTISRGATTDLIIKYPGLLKVVVDRSTAFTGSGTLINIDFEGLLGSVSTNTSLHIENISFDTTPCNTITMTNGVVNLIGCESDRLMADGTMLRQNQPNPFSQLTVVSYQLSMDADVELLVYDMFGRKVKTLTEGFQTKGEHSVTFEPGDLPNGMYVYQLRFPRKIFSKKMVVLKN